MIYSFVLNAALTSRPNASHYSLRQTAMRGSGSHWGWTTSRANAAVTNANLVRLRGRHLLDHEALTCLLVLLFVDDSKLNTNRLHRVLRNLCYYAPTRMWVINTLLSVLQRLTDSIQEMAAADEVASERRVAVSPKEKLKKRASHHDNSEHGSPLEADSQLNDELPAWLNVYLCAALGSQTNVFRLQRNLKRHHSRASGSVGPAATGISIHPQASALVCRHVLDTLISLAKSFPSQFLPELKSINTSKDRDDKDPELDEKSKGKDSKPDQTTLGKDLVPSGKADVTKSSTDFWDLLVKLDCVVGGKKGKGIPRLQSSVFIDCGVVPASYESSPLGQLMMMLSHPVVRRSHLLTDRLLRLLGLISGALPDVTAQTPASSTSASARGTAPGIGVCIPCVRFVGGCFIGKMLWCTLSSDLRLNY